jgi:3-oxoacyl-[acyl-carrier-protein] synthase II
MRKVVITGVGCLAPRAYNTQSFWRAMSEAQSLLGPITRFDISAYRTRIGGEIDADISKVSGLSIQTLSRNAQFSLAAAKEALEQAGMAGIPALANTGICLGSGLGGIYYSEESLTALHRIGPRGVSPAEVPYVDPNGIVSHIAIRWGLRGPQLTISTACSSSAHAIGHAMDWIRHGRCDAVLAGGVEATITPLLFAGFDRLRAMSVRNDTPDIACQPFSDQRDGFVMSEGAAMLFLEEESAAIARGATILAQVMGYGSTGGAHHIVSPRPDGEDLMDAMRKALHDANLTPDEVDLISPHATGTRLNDDAEEKALRAVFGSRLDEIAITPTKQLTGHLLGAAGALEAVHTVLSLHHSKVTPIRYYLSQRPLNILTSSAARTANTKPLEFAVKNSFGFGNNNVSLVFGRYPS